jgi:tRNA threonylcarbamoyladenosine biosynthesis protein TsaB
MIILHIDTIIQAGSVAITEFEKVSAIRHLNSAHHASSLHGLIQELMSETSTSFSNLSAVSISQGPGSYTGLRIGTSAAKGICYAMDIPLIAVDTLAAMSAWMQQYVFECDIYKPLFRPMIDAGRREVYSALYDARQKCLKAVEAFIIEPVFFSEIPDNHVLYLGGNGAFKFSDDIVDNKQVRLIQENIHTAEALVPIAVRKYLDKDFEDLAYYEPLYLKKYIPGKSYVKGLR